MDTVTQTSDPSAPTPTRRPTSAPTPRSLLRARDFRLLWSAYSVSAIGSEVTVLAIPLAAAVLLGATPLQMGLLAAAGTAPYVGFALLVGAWIDRLPRRRPLLVAADLVAAAALLTVPLAWLAGGLTVAQLIVVELVVGVARVIFRPAFGAHLPDVVPERALTQASARLRAAEATAMLVGPGLGGSLVQLLTAPVAVVVDAVSFVASAVLVGRVRAPERVGHVARRDGGCATRSPRAWATSGATAACGHRRRRGEPELLRADDLRASRRLPHPRAELLAGHGRGRHDGRWRWLAGRRAPGAPGGRPDRSRPHHRARIGCVRPRHDRLPGRPRPALDGAGRSRRERGGGRCRDHAFSTSTPARWC